MVSVRLSSTEGRQQQQKKQVMLLTSNGQLNNLIITV